MSTKLTPRLKADPATVGSAPNGVNGLRRVEMTEAHIEESDEDSYITITWPKLKI